MKKENNDFASLVETWVLLETESAKLAAQRRTDQDILDINKAQDTFANKVKLEEQAVEEDFMFHLKIAEASKNTVLKSLILIIMPDLINNFLQLNIYKQERAFTVIDEHEVILEYIVAQNPEKAVTAMEMHLKDVFDYSQRLKNRLGNGTNDKN